MFHQRLEHGQECFQRKIPSTVEITGGEIQGFMHPN